MSLKYLLYLSVPPYDYRPCKQEGDVALGNLNIKFCGEVVQHVKQTRNTSEVLIFTSHVLVTSKWKEKYHICQVRTNKS